MADRSKLIVNRPTILTNKKRIFLTLVSTFHVIAAAQFWLGVYYDYMFVYFPPSQTNPGSMFGGKFRYLTFIDAILQSLYYTISVVNDIIGTNEVRTDSLPAIRRAKDFLLAALAFPVSCTVGISFWCLMAIDRELVFPKELDAIFPSWLNHIMHTNIVVFIVLEMFISFRHYPKRKHGLLALAVFMIIYLTWIHIIYYYSGQWVYPILTVLNYLQRTLFFIVILASTFSLYFVGEFLNKIIWTKELKQAARKSH